MTFPTCSGCSHPRQLSVFETAVGRHRLFFFPLFSISFEAFRSFLLRVLLSFASTSRSKAIPRSVMSLLLHLYQGAPFLQRAQILNEIVQLLLTAPDVRLIQLWAPNIHDTFNAMHHKLLSPDYDSTQRTSVNQAENLVAERLEQVQDGLRSYLSNMVSQVQVEELLCKGRLVSEAFTVSLKLSKLKFLLLCRHRSSNSFKAVSSIPGYFLPNRGSKKSSCDSRSLRH